MEKYSHGGEIYNKKVTLDYSTNINPLGLPSSVKSALINNMDQFVLYPDNNCSTLSTAIADYEQIKKDFIICGNGASDLIFRLCFALKPQKALLLAPTFSEYEKALHAAGSEIDYYLLDEKEKFAITDKLVDDLNESIDILFLCNPNNPVGNMIRQDVLEKIMYKCLECNIFLVMDECFLDFVAGGKDYSLKRYVKDIDSLFVLKAFTKIYAMAGLRLGYGMCSNTQLLTNMQNMGPSWNVSIPAQIAGVEALKQSEYIQETEVIIKKERSYLYNNLLELGLKVFEPSANYIFFKSIDELYEVMLAKGILIRQCDNYNQLSREYYRIAVRNHEDNIELINQLRNVNLTKTTDRR